MNDDRSAANKRQTISTTYMHGGVPYSMDFCFDFTGLLLGAAGAVGVGFYTGFFKKIPPSLMTNIPSNVKTQMKKVGSDSFSQIEGKVKQFDGILGGGSLAWRIAKRATLGSLLYCFLECRLQGRRYYRSIFDCALAGGLSGLAFGARGGLPMAGYSAAGFSAFAVASHFLYH